MISGSDILTCKLNFTKKKFQEKNDFELLTFTMKSVHIKRNKEDRFLKSLIKDANFGLREI